MESLPVLVLLAAPLHLAESCKAWEEHVLKVVLSSDVLGPHVCLYSEDMCDLFCCHLLCGRLI